MNKTLTSLVAGAALGASQLDKNADASFFPTSGLERYYSFDEGAGSIVSDSTFHHTMIMSDSWTQNGKINSGYNPNGFLYDTGFNTSKSNGMSVNFWLKKTGSWGPYTDIIGTGSDAGEFYIDTASEQSLMSYLAPGIAPHTPFQGDGNWHMVTLTIENGVQRGYVDEVEQFEHTLPFSFSDETIKLFGGLGGSSPNNILNFDELGIWNRALSASEVSSLYNHGQGLQYSIPQPSGVGLVGLLGLAGKPRRRK